jgi:hypothetical protein
MSKANKTFEQIRKAFLERMSTLTSRTEVPGGVTMICRGKGKRVGCRLDEFQIGRSCSKRP